MPFPARGDIWYADLSPTRGHEQAGKRPVLVVSDNTFNHGPAELVIVIPLTSMYRGIPTHVPLIPPEGGLTKTSYVLCEAIRAISKERLFKRFGMISVEKLQEVEDRIRILLAL